MLRFTRVLIFWKVLLLGFGWIKPNCPNLKDAAMRSKTWMITGICSILYFLSSCKNYQLFQQDQAKTNGCNPLNMFNALK